MSNKILPDVYLAGPIFTEAHLLYNEFLLNGIFRAWPGLKVYASQTNKEINDKTKSADSIAIYNGDYARLKNTDILIALISGDVPPIGTITEVGIFSEMHENDPKKQLIALYTDTRDPAFTYSNEKNLSMSGKTGECQYSYINLFSLGACKKNGTVLTSSEELFNYIHELWIQKSKEVYCGIYKITNRENGKIYIGQSKDIFNRWKAHISRRNNPHNNSAIESALGKYGIENFELDILELCEEKDLNEAELKWIQQYNSYAPNGYNIAIGGQNFTNQEQLKEISCYDLDTYQLITTYPSIREAARITHFDRQRLSECCNNKEDTCTCGGMYWAFGHALEITPRIPQGGTSTKKKVYQYDLNTKQLIGEYESQADAARALGDINYNKNISSACRGKRHYAYGFIWSNIKWDTAPDNYKLLNEKNNQKINNPDISPEGWGEDYDI